MQSNPELLPLPNLRQSAAELLAYALCDLFPGTHLVRSVISNIDFYYDVVIPVHFDEGCLTLLEEKMRALAKATLPVKSIDMMRENAVQFLIHHNQPIKAEIVSNHPSNIIRLLQIEDFIDTAPHAHMTSTNQVSFFKLQNAIPLTIYLPELGSLEVIRIRGTAFHEKSDLKKQLKKVARAEKYNHWYLGTEMRLFRPINEELFQWEPRGTALVKRLLGMIEERQLERGFEELLFPSMIPDLFSSRSLPPMAKHEINETSWISFPPAPLVPLLAQSPLPLRRFGVLSSCNLAPQDQLHGLLNSRLATLDLSQILCDRQLLDKELKSSLQFIDKFIKIIGFEYHWYLAANQNVMAGCEKSWKIAYSSLEKALKESVASYSVDKSIERCYGPRAELALTDGSGREWRLSFLSIDVVQTLLEPLEKRESSPLRISYSVCGFVERLIAILLERFEGQLPLWLLAEQVRIIPLSRQYEGYAEEIQAELKALGFRCTIDKGHAPLGERTYLAEKERIPYSVIVGEKEEKKRLITLRSSLAAGQNEAMSNEAMSVADLVSRLQTALQKGYVA